MEFLPCMVSYLQTPQQVRSDSLRCLSISLHMVKNISLFYASYENCDIFGWIIAKTMRIRRRRRMKKYICPYCLTEHKSHDVVFRCANPCCRVAEDEVLNMYEPGIPHIKSGIVYPKKAIPNFISLGRMPKEAFCPECRIRTTYRLCPTCHNELPPMIDEGGMVIISVIGSRASGKSHYLGVLLHELHEHFFPEVLGGSFVPALEDTDHWYRVSYGDDLYRRRELLPLTPPFNRQKPMIYSAKYQINGNTRNLAVVFYDAAGERLEDEHLLTTTNKYISHSDGIIFLLDPTQIAGLRERMHRKVLEESSCIPLQDALSKPQDLMIHHIAALIRQTRHLPVDGRIQIPFALTLSKLDSIENLLPRENLLGKADGLRQEGRYDRGELREVDAEMRSLLQKGGADILLKSAELEFGRVSCFGVSALGNPPMLSNNNGRHINRLEPKRVEDPFAWILDQLQLMPK